MLDTINFSIIALALVLLLIAFRQLGEFKLQIWQIMLFGALLVLLSRADLSRGCRQCHKSRM